MAERWRTLRRRRYAW